MVAEPEAGRVQAPSGLGLRSVPDAAAMVRAGKLTKTFGFRRGLRGLDLSVIPGERVAVIGANGAGKSTLVRLLGLLIRPTSGFLEIAGQDASAGSREIRRLLGVALHDGLLYPDLTVAENVGFTARLYSMDRVRDRTAALLDRFALSRIAGSRVRHLSRGQRQRVSVARALIDDPRLVLLDEPDTGMDAYAFDLMCSQLEADPGRTVIFTTHRADHALALATRLLLLDEGRARDLGPAAGWTPAGLAELLLVASGDKRARA